MAIVAGGPHPKFADNTVLIYDVCKNQFVLEFLFPSPVKAVRIRRDKLVFNVVVFSESDYVYEALFILSIKFTLLLCF